ncbi:MAG: LysR family transcriptional regulator [Clostridiales bacterium]|nr:LysR family transcriptional regulator [Clostridiales bacterium]
MTLTQMNYLMEIYKCGSMNKAAQNLFVSQSALSSTIRELEEELGITVFHRSNRGITLTEDGRELLAQITPIVEQNRKLLRYYAQRLAPDKAKLAISAQRYPFCAKAFVEFLHELQNPHIEVSLKETEMGIVIEDVARQESDLGIIFLSDVTEHYIKRIFAARNLEFHQLVKIRPRVFLRKGHPLSGAAALHVQQLRAYPYVMFTQRENNFNYAEEAVVGTGADFNQVVYVNDRATAYNVMAHTDCFSTGSGVLPDGYGDERITAIPLADPVDDMRLGYIKIRGVPVSELGGRFVAILERIMGEIGE